MNGFDDFDTQVQCEEVYQEDAISTMCLHCGEQEIVGNFTYENGDGFCSAECNNTAHEEMFAAHSISVERVEFEDFLSQYDDDPNPYAGTYSEE